VQDAIFGLGAVKNGWTEIPDDVVERLLTLLSRETMYASHLAGHLLNFFEFEAQSLTTRQKSWCVGFLKLHGDRFTEVHSRQVVAELRGGHYLVSSTPV